MCKCKWFTLTLDLHAGYTTIDTHTHNTEPDLVSVQFFLTQIKTDD
jgi:hypothetical protein